MKTLVIIPTYNERENIAQIVPAVLGIAPEVEVLVVDDSSPDGTAQVVTQMQNPRVHLLLRTKKEGLGRAYLSAFGWALQHGAEKIVQMDADFSHRPQDLKPLLLALDTHDFAIGSRYVSGGKVVNWGLGRKIISRGGGIYSSLILGVRLADWTGGFNAWNRRVLEGIGLHNVTSNGYSFQIELKYRARKKGFQFREVPIVFEDRRVGKSKMSSGIFFEAVKKVWKLRWTV